MEKKTVPADQEIKPREIKKETVANKEEKQVKVGVL